MEVQGEKGKSIFFYKNNNVGGLVLLDIKTKKTVVQAYGSINRTSQQNTGQKQNPTYCLIQCRSFVQLMNE